MAEQRVAAPARQHVPRGLRAGVFATPRVLELEHVGCQLAAVHLRDDFAVEALDVEQDHGRRKQPMPPHLVAEGVARDGMRPHRATDGLEGPVVVFWIAPPHVPRDVGQLVFELCAIERPESLRDSPGNAMTGAVNVSKDPRQLRRTATGFLNRQVTTTQATNEDSAAAFASLRAKDWYIIDPRTSKAVGAWDAPRGGSP